MFFIFSYELLPWAIFLGVYLLLLVAFPVPTLIFTGVLVWALVANIKKRRKVED